MALRGFIYTISADIYAYRFAFSGKTHCILHRFTLRFAPKRTAFSIKTHCVLRHLWAMHKSLKAYAWKTLPLPPLSEYPRRPLSLNWKIRRMCLLPCSQRSWTHSYNARMRSLQLRWNSSIPSCRSSVPAGQGQPFRVLGGILCENHAQGACSNDIVRGTLSPLHSLNCMPRIRHIYPTGYSCTASHNIVQIGRCQQCANSLLLRFS